MRGVDSDLMDDTSEVLLSLTVTAYRSDRAPARLFVRRTDRPVEYGFLSPAELGYLLEALLLAAHFPEPPAPTDPHSSQP